MLSSAISLVISHISIHPAFFNMISIAGIHYCIHYLLQGKGKLKTSFAVVKISDLYVKLSIQSMHEIGIHFESPLCTSTWVERDNMGQNAYV